jgi:hypothetical protein
MEAIWLVDFNGPSQRIEFKNANRRQHCIGGHKDRPIMLADSHLRISAITANE